jgi:hypothetical protein
MVLNHVLNRLQSHPADQLRAVELGQLGFMEWLGSLPGDSDFDRQARAAYARALPFQRVSPAIAVFCALLLAARRMPPEPLNLCLPRPHRRGGSKARRQVQ